MGTDALIAKNPDSIFAQALRHWKQYGLLPGDLHPGILQEMCDGMPKDAPAGFQEAVRLGYSPT